MRSAAGGRGGGRRSAVESTYSEWKAVQVARGPADQARSEPARLDSPAWSMAYTPAPATITSPSVRIRPSGPSEADNDVGGRQAGRRRQRPGEALEAVQPRQERRPPRSGDAFERAAAELDVALELVAHVAVGDELADLGVAGGHEQGLADGRRALDADRDGDEGVEHPAGSAVVRLGPAGHEQPPHPQRPLARGGSGRPQPGVRRTGGRWRRGCSYPPTSVLPAPTFGARRSWTAPRGSHRNHSVGTARPGARCSVDGARSARARSTSLARSDAASSMHERYRRTNRDSYRSDRQDGGDARPAGGRGQVPRAGRASGGQRRPPDELHRPGRRHAPRPGRVRPVGHGHVEGRPRLHAPATPAGRTGRSLSCRAAMRSSSATPTVRSGVCATRRGPATSSPAAPGSTTRAGRSRSSPRSTTTAASSSPSPGAGAASSPRPLSPSPPPASSRSTTGTGGWACRPARASTRPGRGGCACPTTTRPPSRSSTPDGTTPCSPTSTPRASSSSPPPSAPGPS